MKTCVRSMSDKCFRVLALTLILIAPSPAFAGETEWKSYMDAGASAQRSGDYSTAAARLEAALREAQLFSPSDPRLARTLNNLGGIYETQGRYSEAESVYRRSLGIAEKVLGSDHPDVGTALNNLANLYQAQGRFAEAGLLHQRSLSIREKALGLAACRTCVDDMNDSGHGKPVEQ